MKATSVLIGGKIGRYIVESIKGFMNNKPITMGLKIGNLIGTLFQKFF
jgi:hypothetical protein